MQASTGTYNETKLRELADNPTNVVYHHVYDTPAEILPPQEQIEVFRAMIAAFDGAAIAFPGACDEALRERVLRNDRVRRFQRLYPSVFASCTYRALTPDMEAELDKYRKGAMVCLTERLAGEGDEDEKGARAMHTGMRLAMRDTKPEDLENGVSLDSAAADAGVNASQMTPMDRMALGPSTVRQTL